MPAQVGGRWTLADGQGRVLATLDVVQQFQKIGGTMTIGGRAQPLLGAFVAGRELGFSYVDRDGGFRTARLEVDGDRASGVSRLGESEIKVGARRG